MKRLSLIIACAVFMALPVTAKVWKAEKLDKLKVLLEKYNYLVIPNTFDAVDKTLVQLCKVAEKEEKKDAAK